MLVTPTTSAMAKGTRAEHREEMWAVRQGLQSGRWEMTLHQQILQTQPGLTPLQRDNLLLHGFRLGNTKAQLSLWRSGGCAQISPESRSHGAGGARESGRRQQPQPGRVRAVRPNQAGAKPLQESLAPQNAAPDADMFSLTLVSIARVNVPFLSQLPGTKSLFLITQTFPVAGKNRNESDEFQNHLRSFISIPDELCLSCLLAFFFPMHI